MAKGRFVPDEEEQSVEIRTGFTPARPTMPLPAAETDRERRDESFDPTTAESPNPQLGDPSGDTPRESRPQTDRDTQEGFFPEVHSSGITGHFDAWLGEVMQTYYSTGHSSGSDFGLISVRRSDVDWDATTNYPTGFEVNATLSQRTPGIVDAKPFPLRNDQQKYVVSVGDFVIVVTGRDNRHWYMVDELPFVGMVIDNTQEGGGSETKENFSGGAGNKSLCVRLQKMTGDPDGANWLGATLADADGASSANIDFTGVKPVGPTNVSHGYRVGDFVFVFKRGRYLFCNQAPQVFVGAIKEAGPDGEDNFENARYWVSQQDGDVTYSSNTISDIIFDDRTRAVTGQNGTSGRWITAYNFGEDTTHRLDTGQLVICVMQTEPDTKEPYYVFDHQFNKDAPTPKSAIVQNGSGGDYNALFCTEAPEYRFNEYMSAVLNDTFLRVPIDMTYLRVTEPGSIHVFSYVAEHLLPGPVAVRTDDGAYVVIETAVKPMQPTTIRFVLSGIVRGRTERFPARTKEQHDTNNHFWSEWAHEHPGTSPEDL